MFELSNVNVKVGHNNLLSSLNLRFEEGRISAIMGANGAGKSTLFKCLLGEYPLATGDVYFKGKTIDDFTIADLSMQRAYIAQIKPSMFSMLVLEYLLLARMQYNESAKYAESLVLTIATQFSITHFVMRDLTTLSGGELQLVEFVRAYLQVYETDNMEGKCLLLDEPASALDIKQTRQLYKHLKAFQKQLGTVIIIDHDINQVATLASNIAFLKKGELLCYGKSHDVFSKPNLDECFDTEGKIISSANHNNYFYHLAV
jgi:ABC-type cobalamin/Fe3+-siderophores transport system ATPase subunit